MPFTFSLCKTCKTSASSNFDWSSLTFLNNSSFPEPIQHQFPQKNKHKTHAKRRNEEMKVLISMLEIKSLTRLLKNLTLLISKGSFKSCQPILLKFKLIRAQLVDWRWQKEDENCPISHSSIKEFLSRPDMIYNDHQKEENDRTHLRVIDEVSWQFISLPEYRYASNRIACLNCMVRAFEKFSRDSKWNFGPKKIPTQTIQADTYWGICFYVIFDIY